VHSVTSQNLKKTETESGFVKSNIAVIIALLSYADTVPCGALIYLKFL